MTRSLYSRWFFIFDDAYMTSSAEQGMKVVFSLVKYSLTFTLVFGVAIFWLLKNGFLRRGMPSWSSLPEPTRWQVVTYVKSLGLSSQDHSSERKGSPKQ